MPYSIEDIEQRLQISLPSRHKRALLDTSDPIHKNIFLLTPNGNSSESIFERNSALRKLDWKLWPDYLVAFATCECGDYFAFDTRTLPYRVYYIDPNETVPESIASCEQEAFVFESFDDWYEYETSQET